ncbi:PstS family phosphate ABC transporter substrate-binding protein [Clostridium formicaceticum]|uniref:Phosphate-binding protein n=1 Tax=Clostridium formicaceticum TaxID=1497 RepID=A0AAC9WK80_9CLOT|nr:PstS family phosphate ABC transporter substrate-binding protein [Clostridium formicaceticum]AOY75196.1 phosphate ABC transporter phosphate-binding protein [Clostridium formicaceticum]ARE89625.1 Phosphate-binding protein PstS precursor [Clostridium formicaceticum]
MLKKLFMLLLVAGLAIVSVACSGQTQENPADNTVTSEENVTELSGAVIVDGSGTVYPLMAHIAEEYMTKEQGNVSVQVGRAGSSAGFKKFIPGELDFADASRAIKDEEAAELEERGLKVGEEVLEFKLALDGLTMVINKDNDWAREMTKEEVVDMYLSGTYREDDKVLWSDIRSDWPAEEVKFYGPNENHGTYEFFYEVILGKQDMVKTANLQQEYSTLVDLVSNDKNAIAFFGFGYYVNNQDKITAVKIDFGNGSVEPTLATIGENLPYAGFTRPVFTYLNAVYAKEKPQVLDFAKYVVSPNGAQRLAGDNGFAPLPAAQYAEYLQQLEAIK